MKSFKLNDRMQIIAKFEKSRSGFRHRATLLVDGREVDETTASYQNRTWESYEYESAINKLIDKTSHIPVNMKQRYKDKLAGKSHEDIQSQFKTISMVAKLGDIMTKNKKEGNVWKKRMLKAGMGAGLDFPKDWEKLPEGTKKARLNKVIEHLAGSKSSNSILTKPIIKLNVAKPDIKALLREKFLEPQYDTRKSFHKKAKIREYGDRKVLQSYTTDVAEIINGKPIVKGLYSDTTTRHIKEFLRQSGFKADSSKQILKDYSFKEDKKAKAKLNKLMKM